MCNKEQTLEMLTGGTGDMCFSPSPLPHVA